MNKKIEVVVSMYRRSFEDLKAVCSCVSRSLAAHGSKYIAVPSRRNNYYAVDRIIRQSGTVADTLVTGSLSDCLLYVQGMQRSLDLLT